MSGNEDLAKLGLNMDILFTTRDSWQWTVLGNQKNLEWNVWTGWLTKQNTKHDYEI